MISAPRHRAGRRCGRPVARAVSSGLGLALLLATGPTRAVELVQNLSYNRMLNPWDSGSPLVKSWQGSYGGHLAVDIPTVDLSLSGLLSSFLDLPKIGFIESSLRGQAGLWLDLGYQISGGVLAMKYPGQARLDFGSTQSASRFNSVSTGFAPGLKRISVQPESVANVLGAGYRPPAGLASSFGYDWYSAPSFATSFPQAAAWASLRYDAQASLGITAGVARAFGECLLCKRLEAGIGAADTIPLLKVDSRGAEIAGLPPVELFGQRIGLGAASVQLNYPDVKVSGGLAADGRTLSGEGSANLIRFDASLEKLVPVVGAFLSQKLGPVDLTLLSGNAGPDLSVYQRFDVAVAPKVQLDFSGLVYLRRGGETTIGRRITVDLGESFEWRPFFIPSGEVTVRPTYLLDGSVHNVTGLGVGVHLDVDALKASLPPLPTMGPVEVARVNETLLKIPVYDHRFDIERTSLPGAPAKLSVAANFVDGASMQVHLVAADLLGAPTGQRPAPGQAGTWRLSFDSVLGPFSTLVSGHTAGVLLDDGVPLDLQSSGIGFYAGLEDTTLLSDLLLLADAPVTAELQVVDAASATGYSARVLELGDMFCIVCSDLTGALGDQGNFIADGETRLYMNRLDQVFVDPGVASSFSTDHALVAQPVITQQISAVPEPAMPALWLAGMVATVFVARRRGTAGRPVARA